MPIRYLQNAWNHLSSQGRPYEQAAFQHAFHHGPVEPVMEALQQYQNEDGGFQCCFEPDNRSTASSALATSVALREMRRLELPPTEPMVQFAIKHLLDTLDPEHLTWRILPPEAQHSPHAPWWDNGDGTLESRFGGYRFNPRADLLGSLWAYQELVPEDLLQVLTMQVVQQAPQAMEMHDLICLSHLVAAPNLPAPIRQELVQVLRQQAVPQVAKTLQEMQGYVLLPLQLAFTPQHPLAQELSEPVQVQLQLLQDQQKAEGHWEPAWSWGADPAWKTALPEWQSCLTLQNALTLQAWGA